MHKVSTMMISCRTTPTLRSLSLSRGTVFADIEQERTYTYPSNLTVSVENADMVV
jgi:hypothetical protein